MGKMIDEGELVKVLKERATNEAICGYMTAYDVTNSIIDEVNEQPTAYDQDKIVEQLNDKFRVVRTDEDLEWNRAMDEAITIVNGGGVDGN